MCLGVPGEVVQIGEERGGLLMGKVSFGGVVREVCLAYTPEVTVGEYVLVHVGFALSKLDEQEATELFSYLEQIDALERAARAVDAEEHAAAAIESKSAAGPSEDAG